MSLRVELGELALGVDGEGSTPELRSRADVRQNLGIDFAASTAHLVNGQAHVRPCAGK